MLFDFMEWDLRTLQTLELHDRCFFAWQTAQQLYQWRLQLLEEQKACVQKRMELLDQQETFLLDFISARNRFPREEQSEPCSRVPLFEAQEMRESQKPAPQPLIQSPQFEHQSRLKHPNFDSIVASKEV